MKRLVIALAVITHIFQVAAAAQTARTAPRRSEQELLRANRDYDAALVAGNAGALERIFADDFVYTNPDGLVRNKAQQLAFTRSGDLRFDRGGSDDVRVRVYGNTAVMTGRFAAKGVFKGRPFEVNERYTSVWVRRGGRWLLVAEQGNFIKPQGPPGRAGENDSAVEYYVAPERRALNRPYSDAVRVGNTLYLSGAIGTLPGTNQLAAGGIEGETRQTLENIKKTLEANGSSMNEVVRCTVMLADINEWDRMNAVYRTYFPDRRPARSSLGVGGLVQNARVEIECTATVGAR